MADRTKPAPRALTPKQEAFAKAYIETGNASEAYRRTYPNSQKWKPDGLHVNASKLLANAKVALRVQELLAVHQQRHAVTVDSLVAELEEARDLAMKTQTPSAAVAASMGKGKLLGLIVDKADVNNKLQVEAPETAAAIRALLDALPDLEATLGLNVGRVNGVAALVSMAPAESAEGERS